MASGMGVDTGKMKLIQSGMGADRVEWGLIQSEGMNESETGINTEWNGG